MIKYKKSLDLVLIKSLAPVLKHEWMGKYYSLEQSRNQAMYEVKYMGKTSLCLLHTPVMKNEILQSLYEKLEYLVESKNNIIFHEILSSKELLSRMWLWTIRKQKTIRTTLRRTRKNTSNHGRIMIQWNTVSCRNL